MTDIFAGKFFFTIQPSFCGQVIGSQDGAILYQDDENSYLQTVPIANTGLWRFYANRTDMENAFAAYKAVRTMATTFRGA